MTDPEKMATIAQLRSSFFYGDRSNLNFKFAADLSDDEFGNFIEELFAAVAIATDTGNADEVVDTAYRWQVLAYSGHLGDPKDFRYRYQDVPFTSMKKPLAESRLLLLTSSGHFVEGDDPMPLGETDMTQQEAEKRIGEFIKEPPALSRIPIDTPPDRLRVRHGGYPVEAVRADHQVVLPLGHLRELAAEGVVGELVSEAFSFVGAASQGRLRKDIAPEWAEMARDLKAEAVLLVPI
jgi:hypothetical protein